MNEKDIDKIYSLIEKGEYAQAKELLDDIEKLKGWPDSVKTMQKNWIDRSTGAILRFKVKEIEISIITVLDLGISPNYLNFFGTGNSSL